MAIHVMENYVSVEEYAKLCGIKRRTVMDRIKSKNISAIKVDGYYAVDKKENPPRSYQHHAWRNPTGGAYVRHHELRCVITWCCGKSIRCYPYLRAIINGQIEGWVIGDEVFAKASDLEEFRKSRP